MMLIELNNEEALYRIIKLTYIVIQRHQHQRTQKQQKQHKRTQIYPKTHKNNLSLKKNTKIEQNLQCYKVYILHANAHFVSSSFKTT